MTHPPHDRTPSQSRTRNDDVDEPAASSDGADVFDPTIRRGPRRGRPGQPPAAAGPSPEPDAMTVRRGVRRPATSGSDMAVSRSGSSGSTSTDAVRSGLGEVTIAEALGLGGIASVRLPSQRRVAAPAGGDLAGAAMPDTTARLGRYTVQDEIGRGGMGAVLTATDRDLGRDVAMKVILDQNDPETLVRFIREAQISGQLEHPNITPVHELGLDPHGRVYFTMKLVRGDSLTKKLREVKNDVLEGRGDDRFPLAKRLQIFIKICEALAYAHSRGVIHRDLKPDNIMVGEFGEVHVMDWGLARMIGEDDEVSLPEGGGTAILTPKGPLPYGHAPDGSSDGSSRSLPGTLHDGSHSAYRTLEGDVMGTPNYMSPEQARGEIKRLDGRSDIYALGAILYELLTLCRVHPSTNVDRVLRLATEGKFDPPSDRLRREARLAKAGVRVPRELEAIVLKAMAKSPEERYASAAELGDDVDAFRHGRVTSAADYSPLQLTYIWIRTHKLASTVAAAVVLLAASAVFIVQYAGEKAREEQLNDYRARIATIDSSIDEVRAAIERRAFQEAIARAEAFSETHGGSIAAITNAGVVAQYAPELADRATRARRETDALRHEAIRAWVRHELGRLPTPTALLSNEDVAQARAQARAFEPFLAEPGLSDLPLSEFAYWQAMVAMETERPRLLAEAVADAFLVQPESLAAGNTFLLQAQQTLARCLALEPGADPELAALQHHLAVSAFCERHPRLLPRAMLGLAQSLALMPLDAPTPFDSDVPAREMALRALLELVTPDGSLHDSVRDVQSAAQQARFQQEAADLLYALRRGAAAGPPLLQTFDWSNDGTDDVTHEMSGGRSRFLRPVPPAEPGLGPHEWEEVASFSLAELHERLLPNEPAERWQIMSHWPAQLGAERNAPYGVFTLASRETDRTRALIARTVDGHDVIASFLVPHRDGIVRAVAAADFTRNGILDLVVAFSGSRGLESRGGSVFVLLQERPGEFRAEPLFVTSYVSELRSLTAADLTGDGAAELLLLVGEWQELSAMVFEYLVGVERFSPVPSRVRIGDGSAMVHREPNRDHALIIVPYQIGFAISFFYEMQGSPIEHDDLMIFEYRDAELIRLSHPLRTLPMRPQSIRVRHEIVEEDGGERVLVLSGSSPVGNVWRYHHYRGSLLEPEALRTTVVAMPEGLATRDTIPGFMSGRWNSFRTLRHEDLEVVAQHAVPMAEPDVDQVQAVAIVRFLLSSKLPNEAVRVVREARDAQTQRDVLLTLSRLELLALLEAERYDEALDVAKTLPVERSLMADVVFVAETLADIGRYGSAVELLQPWERSTETTNRQRNLVTSRLRDWRAMARLYERMPHVDVRGHQIHVRTDDGVELRHLGDHIFTNTASGLRLDSPVSDGEGDAPSMWHGGGPERVVQRLWPSGGQGDASAVEVGYASGIAVQVGSGSFRVSTEFRFRGVPYDMRVVLGFHSLRAPLGRGEFSPVGASASCGGGNHINDIFGPNRLRLDGLLGRRLRFDMVYLRELDETRVTLSDVESQTVLTEYSAGRVVPAGLALFGLGGGGKRSEVDVYRIVMAGDIRLLLPDDDDLRRALVDAPDTVAVSLAVGAQLRGEWADAAERFGELAATYRAASEQAADADEARLLREQAVRYELERARCLGAGSASAFSRALSTLLEAADVDESAVLQWLLDKPQYRPDADLWAGVGEALSRHLFPGVAPSALVAAAREAWEAGDVYSQTVVAIAAWLHERNPADDQAFRDWVFATARAHSSVARLQSDLYWGGMHMSWRLLGMFDALPQEMLTESVALRLLHASILGSFHRRPEALAALQPDDPEPIRGFRMLQTRLWERAVENQAHHRARLDRHGIEWSYLPRIDELK